MGRKKQQPEPPSFDPTLSRGIIAILLVIVALIITLSFFGAASTVGVILNEWILAFLFGSMRFATPLILLVFAWFILKDNAYDYRPTHGIGAVLFFLTLSSLMHMGFEANDMWRQALDGAGGGVFGMLAWPLKTYLGTVGSVILLIGLAMVSLILLFNTAILHFFSLHKKILSGLGFIGEFVKQQTHTTGEEREEEDDPYMDEDEEETSPRERRFAARNLDSGDDDTGDEDDVEENDEEGSDEDEKISLPHTPKTHVIPAEDDIPEWAKHVIIKAPPKITLLKSSKSKPTSGDIKSNEATIKSTLAEFNIDVDMGEVRVGPTVTQYSLKPSKGVKISRITALSNDLALALAAHPIRIEAPIPGKSLVGIEVPNEKAAMVTFKELLESKEYATRPHDMMFALGKDVGGKIWVADLPKMPHLLVAGATGSGKTVCVNTIIMSLLFQNTAETLRFIMVDPKRVELTLYNGIPHLLTPVITNSQDTVNALRWTISEMDRRFELLSKAGNRDIDSYNGSHPQSKIPHLVFVIDELADLMATASNEVEAGIIRLAQMARAVGIHLIVATQRPSVDVITGLMKANIPGRIAFSVASITDSRTILDSAGAEKLLGRGDMLFSTAALSKPVRIQGAFITEEEMKNVVSYLKGGAKPTYDTSIIQKQKNGTASMFGGPADDQDPLFDEAQDAILESGKASASYLQRRMRIGYARAARILDELEEAGIIGPADGAKPREVLVTEKQVSSTMDMGQEYNVFDEEHDTKNTEGEDEANAEESFVEYDEEESEEESDLGGDDDEMETSEETETDEEIATQDIEEEDEEEKNKDDELDEETEEESEEPKFYR
ncbi:MAG: Cell division protein FtsK/SpoIIIE [Candidatus Magasanikbacteria bacterium GW2011_GWD2_43_18]|uniref:Cell division protein FtsK/SpoIIIE n=1 Tax=Candidatus Magasanikbacteria bacterium GW2011_GWE2_42_7 TaxID=1619052 RepID=A0A0G1DN01_9BACT|nr:MAG: Cell division protein FtsK/SpoIIIE [Candidatus Magasanikbacteria bacterium GW2011_GWC2_42_27]KKS72196.1 MAG: Cell division protein FtsK/SpoIIIE [Candidatus Magasanikbacteria bacterium GW2011_GWE2_42_7]KKT04922.1 MAG: Cell division protein FtsK/SpoIIIE [Candidatus Magasanikbacteria bacterium GW2011_GWD2_43_18]KKT25390.1 MAG: Cell division protein FtsK/SpoIIIE [Candidatus Magasanikbacteria bacterium GW2011_GWA2_43_9]HBB37802.1 cell division protein FtsK [Candidatus Magasanikbacteria bacte